jgi:hypothetical protein
MFNSSSIVALAGNFSLHDIQKIELKNNNENI